MRARRGRSKAHAELTPELHAEQPEPLPHRRSSSAMPPKRASLLSLPVMFLPPRRGALTSPTGRHEHQCHCFFPQGPVVAASISAVAGLRDHMTVFYLNARRLGPHFPAFSLLRRRRVSNSSRVIRVPRIVSQCMKNGCEKLLFIPMTYTESVRRSAVLELNLVHTW